MAKNLAESTIAADPAYSHDFIDVVDKAVSQFEKQFIEHTIKLMSKYNKPVYGVNFMSDSESKTVYNVKDYSFSGIFFPTPERAVKSLAGMYEYYHYLEKNHSVFPEPQRQ